VRALRDPDAVTTTEVPKRESELVG